MKKYLFLIIAIAGVALLFLGGYFLRQYMNGSEEGAPAETGGLPDAGNQTGAPSDQIGSSPTGQPSLGDAAFKQVVAGSVFEYFVESAGSVLFVQPDGQIVEGKDGKNTALSTTKVEGLARASFSYDGGRVLEVFGQPKVSQASVFNTKTKTWQPLSFVPEAHAWSPTDNRLAFITHSGEMAIVSTLDLSNAKAKPVELLRVRLWETDIRWPSKSKIFLEEKTTSLTRGSVWVYDIDKKTLARLVTEKRGLKTTWNSGASLGLALSVSETSGSSLFLLDATGKSIQGLDIETRPDKCAFSDRVETVTSTQPVSSSTKNPPPLKTKTVRLLSCAVPRSPTTILDKVLLDDYDKGGFYSVDNFYQINLEDGSSRPILADESKNLDASKVRVHLKRLYFVDRYGTGLYSLAI